MEIVQVTGPGRWTVAHIPAPVPGPHDVVVAIGACGICGSDIHYVRHGMMRRGGEPTPLGHEAAGTVEQVGVAVKNYSVGARVLINPVYPDGETIGNGGREGAFCERLLLRHADTEGQLIPLPDGLSFAHAAIAEPFAVALHGVNRAEVNPESKVAVFGCGPIGMAAIVWLRRRGVAHIAAVDISEDRLRHAKAMGADWVIDPRDGDLFEQLVACHGHGEKIMDMPTVGTTTFLDMAGGPTVIRDICRVARLHARLVVTAVYPEPVAMDMLGILMKEMVITTAGGYPVELPQALEALCEIEPDTRERYISNRFPFARFEEAFRIASSSSSAKVMIDFETR